MIYVLQVQTGKELKVCAELRWKGFEAYTPREELLIHKGGLWSKMLKLLFPGYVFVVMSYNAENHYIIKNTDGVIRFLGNPTPVNHREEDKLKWLFNDGKIISSSTAEVDENDNMQIVSGFLKDKQVCITRFNKRQKKATIEVSFGGRTHKANLGLELLKAPIKLTR